MGLVIPNKNLGQKHQVDLDEFFSQLEKKIEEEKNQWRERAHDRLQFGSESPLSGVRRLISLFYSDDIKAAGQSQKQDQISTKVLTEILLNGPPIINPMVKFS